MLLTVTEVKRHVGASQQYNWQETAKSLNLKQEQLREDVWLDTPIEVQLAVKNGGDRLILEGDISLRLRMTCGRCLSEFTQDACYPLEEQILFSSYTGQQNSSRDIADEEDRSLPVLEGDTVDVTQMVSDTLLSFIPMKPLCREDCMGLCPICGSDFNQGMCSCADQDTDPRLAALANWLEDGAKK